MLPMVPNAKEAAPDSSYEMSQRSHDSDPDTNVAHGYPTAASEEPTALERYITLKPVVAFGLTLQAAWEAIAISFQSSLVNGGPAALVYGIVVVVLGNMAIAATLGEMAAVDPAVGAQYRWAARYAPKNLKPRFWGFMQGWMSYLAWLAACTLSPFSVAQIIQSMIIFNYPSYHKERWHVTLIAWAAIVLPVVWNLFARRILVALEISGGILHFVLFIAVVTTLGVLIPRSSNKFVWDTVLAHQQYTPDPPTYGWANHGVAVCVGLLPSAFAVGGFDGIIHMSDETKNAAKRVPRAMVLTVLINGILAFSFIICLLYTLEIPISTVDLFANPIPFILIVYTATGSQAATNAIMSLILLVVLVSCFSILASVSRLGWAFARDGGLPFSDFFGYVHPRLKIPLNSLILTGVLCALLCLINIASLTAFGAVISLATLALYISYTPPIIFLLIRKWQGEPPRGPWQLGRFGVFINIFALCFGIFMIIWLPFPVALPINKDTMNYSSCVWLGVMLLALADWLTFGHKRFRLKA